MWSYDAYLISSKVEFGLDKDLEFLCAGQSQKLRYSAVCVEGFKEHSDIVYFAASIASRNTPSAIPPRNHIPSVCIIREFAGLSLSCDIQNSRGNSPSICARDALNSNCPSQGDTEASPVAGPLSECAIRFAFLSCMDCRPRIGIVLLGHGNVT
jgi:hypothetical protein